MCGDYFFDQIGNFWPMLRLYQHFLNTNYTLFSSKKCNFFKKKNVFDNAFYVLKGKNKLLPLIKVQKCTYDDQFMIIH